MSNPPAPAPTLPLSFTPQQSSPVRSPQPQPSPRPTSPRRQPISQCANEAGESDGPHLWADRNLHCAVIPPCSKPIVGVKLTAAEKKVKGHMNRQKKQALADDIESVHKHVGIETDCRPALHFSFESSEPFLLWWWCKMKGSAISRECAGLS